MALETFTSLRKVLRKYPVLETATYSKWSAFARVIYNETDYRLPRGCRFVVYLGENEQPWGWSWLVPSLNLNTGHSQFAFMLFVFARYRQKGVGSTLLKFAEEMTRNCRRRMIGFPHDTASRALYKNCEFGNTWFANQVDDKFCSEVFKPKTRSLV